MPGLISCAGVTGSGCITYHAYATLLSGLKMSPETQQPPGSVLLTCIYIYTYLCLAFFSCTYMYKHVHEQGLLDVWIFIIYIMSQCCVCHMSVGTCYNSCRCTLHTCTCTCCMCVSIMCTHKEGRYSDGSHWSENSEHSESSQVDRNKFLLVAVRQTPTNVHTHTCMICIQTCTM